MQSQNNEPSSGWIDISVPLRNGMVHWPGDTLFSIERTLDLERGASYTLSKICMGSHTGTHVDSPLHFLRGHASIDRMPLDATIGVARVIEIHDSESIKAAELQGHGIQQGERLLFKTRNSSYAWQTDAFVRDYVFISREAAHFLAARRVRVVGIDYLSVGALRPDGIETHQALLEAGIWIIEGLDLSPLRAGKYELVCLPLRLDRAEGAPARAIVKPAII